MDTNKARCVSDVGMTPCEHEPRKRCRGPCASFYTNYRGVSVCMEFEDDAASLLA